MISETREQPAARLRRDVAASWVGEGSVVDELIADRRAGPRARTERDPTRICPSWTAPPFWPGCATNPGAEVVDPSLGAAVVSAANWSEIWQKLMQHGVDAGRATDRLRVLGVRVEPVIGTDAVTAARFWTRTRTAGPSVTAAVWPGCPLGACPSSRPTSRGRAPASTGSSPT